LRIGPHPYFKREGNDVILEVPLTVSEAALGTTVEVPTPDGSWLGVKVPPGTSSGARLRLRGRGIKGGDQYIEIKVVVPPAKDEMPAGRDLVLVPRKPDEPDLHALKKALPQLVGAVARKLAREARPQ